MTNACNRLGLAACRSNYIHYKGWVEITYPFPSFNGCTVEVWEWINNFILHFNGLVQMGIKIKITLVWEIGGLVRVDCNDAHPPDEELCSWPSMVNTQLSLDTVSLFPKEACFGLGHGLVPNRCLSPFQTFKFIVKQYWKLTLYDGTKPSPLPEPRFKRIMP